MGEYKIFEVTYNDGGWHSGALPHFFYIAQSKEEVTANSKRYKEWSEWPGDVWIHEVSGLISEHYFENLTDFDISVTVRQK